MSTTASKLKCRTANSKTAWLRKSSTALFVVAAIPFVGAAQSPATWTLTPSLDKVAPGGQFTAELKLKLEEPWHMYSLTTPKPGPTGGPIGTTIKLADSPALAGFELYFPTPKRKFDPNFQIDTETYDKEVSFWLKGQLSKDAAPGEMEITAQMRYQLCSETQCLPPKKVSVSTKLQVLGGAPDSAAQIPAGFVRYSASNPPSSTAPAAAAPAAGSSGTSPQSFGSFLLVAFGFGLAAIFTPCVFPMIPITMSFFLNQGGKGSVLGQAVVFCIGIVLLFTAIGFGLSAALGPFAVVQLGSNPWVNGLICLVFFVFGLSLLGAFEITLPTGLLTKLNIASNRGGYLGTLIMGLTFCLASFACVGPFMGTLLAASVGGDKLQPVAGMMAFSAALASPFFLLALFPSFLQKLPRSGGWMSRVKIVLGFLVLAAFLKYLSNIDQVLQWNVLTRERFLALWVVLFALPGFYLLGFLRMDGIKPDEEVGVGRLLAGIAFLGFSFSLLPGMFGARLGELDAYVPAAAESATAGPVAGAKWLKNDFQAAVSRAKSENKLVLVAFTGYACTNCHWMKANMFPRPEIADALNALVPVELYTDGTDAASEENQKRQDDLFKTVAIPFYAIFDADGKVVKSFPGLTKNPQEFLAFLQAGRS